MPVAQLFRADTRWDYDHSVHLLRRCLAFPPIAPGPAQAIVFSRHDTTLENLFQLLFG
jgi:hypothetical protein